MEYFMRHFYLGRKKMVSKITIYVKNRFADFFDHWIAQMKNDA